MKTTCFTLLLLFLVFGFNTHAQKLEKVWETNQTLKTPESVIYYENKDVIYVSNINGSPLEKDGKGFISKLSANGKIKNLKWVTGLNAPKGMGIFGGKLYVSDIDQLVVIDIENGKIEKKYDAPDAVFLNDVTTRINGTVFVSDMRTGKIYILKNNKFSVWFEDKQISSPNGLLAEHGKLYIGENSIYEIDIETKTLKTAVNEGGGIDGLERDNKGRFIFSHWAGKIFLVVDGKPIKLLDSSANKINSADIDFAQKLNLLLVPTFQDNKVVAYKIID